MPASGTEAAAAYHAAGQAVVAHYLGYPVIEISIGNTSAPGRCVVAAHLLPEDLEIFAAAGPIAERIATDRYALDTAGSSDVRRRGAQARAIIEDRWDAIQAIAHALLETPAMTRGDVLCLLSSSNQDG